MKKRDNIYKKVAAIIVAAIVAIPLTGRAQLTDHGYLDVDWQFNIPINTGFADKAAGWGMSLDGGYYITDNIGVGAFFGSSDNRPATLNVSVTLRSIGTIQVCPRCNSHTLCVAETRSDICQVLFLLQCLSKQR